MPDKKQIIAKPKPLHTVCSGEVTATISEQLNSDYAYLEIKLTRERTSQASDRRAFVSTSFYEKHEEDLVRVIRQAAAWLREAHTVPTSGNANEPLEDYESESRKLEYELEQGLFGE